MRVQPGTWEANNAVCESDSLCDPAVLVSPPQSEPHIRNRRLSPGSGGGGGGGGGGGCTAKVDKLSTNQTLNGPHHEGSPIGTVHTQMQDRERRPPHRGRSFRREGANQIGRGAEKTYRSSHTHKERWVGETLSSLKPPPAFPVKDSPAKLQPAVSYASKVKAGGASMGVAEEPPGIGALLQNQWGLSFMNDSPAVENGDLDSPPVTENQSPATVHPVAGELGDLQAGVGRSSQRQEDAATLLLNRQYLMEAVQFHTQEWGATLWEQKQDPSKVVWYKELS